MGNPITKKDHRERWIAKVGAIEKFHTLYGAPFEDCECGERKCQHPLSRCPHCGRPSNSIYTKPSAKGTTEDA